jgi:sortase A
VLRALNIVGRILVGLGVLLFLFTAYQLWGTGLVEAHSQSVLRGELARQLPRDAAEAAHHLAAASTAPAPAKVAPSIGPPAPGQPVGVIQIPSIGLDQVIVEGVGTAQLRMGPGHYPGTPLPGQAGNASIAGHRTTYAHPFYNLNEVSPGTKIVITTPQGIFVYSATATLVVAPSDVSVLDAASGAVLTLTTCNPRYSAATRMVVKATLARSLLFADVHRHPAAPPPRADHSTTERADALAGTSTGGNLAVAIAWGVLGAALGIGFWLLARRSRRPWAIWVLGVLVMAVVLFLFFASVSPLLPASF